MASPARPSLLRAVEGDIDRRFRVAFESSDLERIQIAHLDPTGLWLSHYVGPPGRCARAALPVRQIVAEGLAIGAAGWLLAHNHPSGDLAPSAADLQVTRCMQSLGLLLGIRLVDHLIYAGSGRLSFREEGLLP